MDHEMLKKQIRTDYERWSGGFEPETEGDIEHYIDYVGRVGVSDEELFDILYEWAMKVQARPIELPARRTSRIRSRQYVGTTLWFVDDDCGARRTYFDGELGHG